MYSEIDILLAKLQNVRPLTPESIKRLSEDFMIDYTYHTNAIEGSTLTLDETALVLREGITIGGKALRHHLEAIGHRDAYYYMEGLVKNKTPLTERTIKEIHSLVLMDRQFDKGVYRRVPVRIGAFYPCPPYEVGYQMEQLLAYYNAEMQDMHVIERAAVFHLIFETIHPFIDGNGRVGRLLINMELMQAGYPPINIKFADRLAYYECFSHYREHDNDPEKMTELIGRYAMDELKRYIMLRFVPEDDALADEVDILRNADSLSLDDYVKHSEVKWIG